MELKEQHRKTFLLKLHEATKELEMHKSCQKHNDDNLEMLEYLDIEIYLIQQKINIIEIALVQNKIDY